MKATRFPAYSTTTHPPTSIGPYSSSSCVWSVASTFRPPMTQVPAAPSGRLSSLPVYSCWAWLIGDATRSAQVANTATLSSFILHPQPLGGSRRGRLEPIHDLTPSPAAVNRSEERRVGKEGRYRWAAEH